MNIDTKVLNWLKKNFVLKLDNYTTDVRFDCPKCGYKNFYFNVSKRIGYCQKASCHYSPSIHTLLSLPGKTSLEIPSQDYMPPNPNPIVKDEVIRLDREQYPPVLEFIAGNFIINNEEAFAYLTGRNLQKEVINQYDMRYGFDTWGKERIYVPIYEDGKMVSYVGRLFKKGDVGLRYSYCPGTKINNFFLNYDYIANFRETICLVENTFVAASFGPDFSTNFGSHLSATQIDKLCNSELKSVVFLWDGGADESAYKAVMKLRKRGMAAAYISLNGKTQPDSLNYNYVVWLNEQAKANLQSPDGCAIKVLEGKS